MSRLLDPKKDGRWPFQWTKPEHTDVGKYLRQHRREQKAAEQQQAANEQEAQRVVAPLPKRSKSA
jgi:hypothetical protein